MPYSIEQLEQTFTEELEGREIIHGDVLVIKYYDSDTDKVTGATEYEVTRKGVGRKPIVLGIYRTVPGVYIKPIGSKTGHEAQIEEFVPNDKKMFDNLFTLVNRQTVPREPNMLNDEKLNSRLEDLLETQERKSSAAFVKEAEQLQRRGLFPDNVPSSDPNEGVRRFRKITKQSTNQS